MVEEFCWNFLFFLRNPLKWICNFWPYFWWTFSFFEIQRLAAEAQVLNSLPPTHKLTDRIQYYVGPTTSRCPDKYADGSKDRVLLDWLGWLFCSEGLGWRVCISRCWMEDRNTVIWEFLELPLSPNHLFNRWIERKMRPCFWMNNDSDIRWRHPKWGLVIICKISQHIILSGILLLTSSSNSSRTFLGWPSFWKAAM